MRKRSQKAVSWPKARISESLKKESEHVKQATRKLKSTVGKYSIFTEQPDSLMEYHSWKLGGVKEKEVNFSKMAQVVPQGKPSKGKTRNR